MVSKKRIVWIDIFKGIGIVLMVLGHINYGTTIERYIDYYIHAFHMPMFYFISGFLYRNETSFIDFLKHKSRSMILPYIVFGIIYFIPYKMQNGNELEYFVRLFYYNDNLLVVNSLWFLTSLFLTELLYYVLYNGIHNSLLMNFSIGILSIFGNIVKATFGIRLPLCLGASLVGLGLFRIGHYFKQYWDPQFIRCFIKIKISYIVLIVIINGILIFYNGYINMRLQTYSNLVLFWLNAIISIVIIIIISNYIHTSLYLSKKVLSLIGRYSIYFLCLNQIIIKTLKGYIFDHLIIVMPELKYFLTFAFTIIIIVVIIKKTINTPIKYLFGLK